MQDQKLENLLNLALDATPRERERILLCWMWDLSRRSGDGI